MCTGWRRVALGLAAVVALSALAGCTSGGSGGPEKVIRYNMAADPRSLDPAVMTDLTAFSAENQMFEGLVRIGEKGPEPAMAADWQVSGDGLTYTFHLRPGLKWSNGDPLTADDFVFAWRRALDPRFGAEYAYQLYYIKNGQTINGLKPTGYKDAEKKEPIYDERAVAAALDTLGAKAVDKTTLVVTLEAPTPYFLGLTAFPTLHPVNKKAVTANPRWADRPDTYVSNGPFMLQSWEEKNKLVMVRNPNYWDRASVKVDRLVYLMVEKASTALNLWETDAVDIIESPPSAELDRLRQEGKLQLAPSFGTYYYLFNNARPPFDRAAVRQALALAIDRKAIVEHVTRGGQVPAYALVAPGAPDVTSDSDYRKTGGDLFREDAAQARRLLSEAGYPEGKGFPEIVLLYNTDENHKAVAEAIAQMWKTNLGITVTPQNQEWKVVLEKRSKKDYVLARAGWFGDYLDPMTFMDLYVTGGGINDAAYSNPRVDQLIDAAKKTADQRVRMHNMHEAEKVLIGEDMAVLPIYYYVNLYLQKPNIKGVYRNALGIIDMKTATVE